jgi:hypothetical protein
VKQIVRELTAGVVPGATVSAREHYGCDVHVQTPVHCDLIDGSAQWFSLIFPDVRLHASIYWPDVSYRKQWIEKEE